MRTFNSSNSNWNGSLEENVNALIKNAETKLES